MVLYLHMLDLETKRMKIDNEFRFAIKKMTFQKTFGKLEKVFAITI